MKFLEVLDTWVVKILKWLLSFSLLLMTVILIGNSLVRNIGISWPFAEEIGRFVLIIVTFSGTAMAVRKGQHISMTALIDLLPQKYKLILLVFINAITGLLFIFLLYSSWRYVNNLYTIKMVSPALRVPLYTVYTVIPVSMFLCAVEYFKNSYANLKGCILFEDLSQKSDGEVEEVHND